MLYQFLKFGLVGIAGFIVDSAVLYLGLYLLGLNLYSGRVLSYLVAASATWALNRLYTFSNSARTGIGRQWSLFLIVNSIGGFVNYGVYAALVSSIDLFTEYPVLAVAIGSVMGLVFNFSLSRSLVFNTNNSTMNAIAMLSQNNLVSKTKKSWILLSSLALMTILFSRGLFDESIGYPDADRILMDGVFIADYLRSISSWSHPLDFAVSYYAQYPALSIGYRPPFFPTIESLFILTLGEHVWSGRMALMCFAVVGFSAFFALIRRQFDEKTAGAAVGLVVSLPSIVGWSWYTMAEIPVLSMILLTAYWLYKYSEGDGAKYLYFSIFSFVAALWTKQTAVFAILWFIPYLISHLGFKPLFNRKEIWISIIILIILVTPLALITFWLGDLNIGQSIGENPRGPQIPRYYWENLILYPKALITEQLTLPVSLLVVCGLVQAINKKDSRINFYLWWIFAVYLFFTSLNDPKLSRYTIFWIPPFCLFAALPLSYIQKSSNIVKRNIIGLFIICSILYGAIANFQKKPQYITAFKEAAAYVLKNAERPVVFVDAYNNGYFTFFIRQFDQKKRFFVFRGDKLFSSSAIETTTWLKIHAQSRQDLKDILDTHGIDLIVAESSDYTGLSIHKEFRDYLQTDDFKKETSFPIESSLPRYRNQSLDIYRYRKNNLKKSEDWIIRLPTIGKIIRIRASDNKPMLEKMNAD
ncbi:MAG: GtrA family protein [Methylococcales bacterium]|nr:GtrA family protein [Methylococcales bacterium]